MLVKNSQDNQIQDITLCNVYLTKRGIWWTLMSGAKPPEAGELCVKSNLTLQQEQDVLLPPQ